MKKTIILFFTMSFLAFSQDVAEFPQPTTLVTMPIAGSLEKGSSLTELRLLPDGGLLANLSVGLSSRFMFGLSYGGDKVIGSGEIITQDWLGASVRYRALDETMVLPAFSIGYNSQGGKINETGLGFYLVASKNYEFFGNFGIHVGLSKSLNNIENEENENGEKINLFFGLDKDVNKDFAVIWEYNAGWNNDKIVRLGEFNWGFRWTFAQKLYLELDMADVPLKKSTKLFVDANREFKITFVEYFN